jgi:malate-CoA ligase subunit alpha
MGHAGAISAAGETAQEKAEALKAAGATIAPTPSDIGNTVARVMKVAA